MNNIIKKFTTITNKPLIPVIFFLITVIATFFFIYDLNRLYPIYIDDWDYSFIYYTNDKLSSIFDVIPSMRTHYTMWGGRLVVHTILQELLYLGPLWADLFNSIVFCLYILFIFAIANKGNNLKPSVILVILMLTWFCQADLGETILWLTGSANYLWGTTILLIFLYPYYTYHTDIQQNKKNSYWMKNKIGHCLLFFICGIIAGWTNENMAVAIGCIIVIFLINIWLKKKSIDKWAISGIIGFGIGALLMLAAPGNFKRYKQELGIRNIEGKPTLDYYFDNIQMIIDGIVLYLLPLLIIYAIILILYWQTNTTQNKKNILITSLIFFIGTGIACAAMIASPVFPPRAWFGVISLLIIAISILYAHLNFSKVYFNILNWVCILAAFVMFISSYTEGRNELKSIRAIVDAREYDIVKQKSEGKKDIIIHSKSFEKRDDLVIPKMYDFPKDTTHWMYQAYKHYHEIETIRILK